MPESLIIALNLQIAFAEKSAGGDERGQATALYEGPDCFRCVVEDGGYKLSAPDTSLGLPIRFFCSLTPVVYAVAGRVIMVLIILSPPALNMEIKTGQAWQMCLDIFLSFFLSLCVCVCACVCGELYAFEREND